MPERQIIDARGAFCPGPLMELIAALRHSATPPRGGLFAMLAMLSKPEAQRSLAFLLAFGEKLQRGVSGA